MNASRKYPRVGEYTPNEGVNNFTTEQIKKELETREHVPSRIEAKEIRREKARAKKHR